MSSELEKIGRAHSFARCLCPAHVRNLMPLLLQVRAEALAPDVGVKNRLKTVELARRSCDVRANSSRHVPITPYGPLPAGQG